MVVKENKYLIQKLIEAKQPNKICPLLFKTPIRDHVNLIRNQNSQPTICFLFFATEETQLTNFSFPVFPGKN